MEKIILKGHKGIGGIAEGEAFVCQEPVNLMADTGNVWTDLKDTTFTNKVGTPSVYGKSFAGKVLVFPTGKGGIFSTNIMMDVATVGGAPKAISQRDDPSCLGGHGHRPQDTSGGQTRQEPVRGDRDRGLRQGRWGQRHRGGDEEEGVEERTGHPFGLVRLFFRT